MILGRQGLAKVPGRDDEVVSVPTGRLYWNGKRRFWRVAAELAQDVEPRGQIGEPLGDDVDHILFALQFAGTAEQSGAEGGATEAFEDRRPQDQVGDPGLVLDGDEDHALGAARTLPDQHDP